MVPKDIFNNSINSRREQKHIPHSNNHTVGGEKENSLVMLLVYLEFLLLSSWASAFVGPNLIRNPPSEKGCRYVHSAVVSPLSTQPPLEAAGLNQQLQDRDHDETFQSSENLLSKLCLSLDAKPMGLLRFESTPDGVRGVYLNNAVDDGDVILSIPLESCLADNTPPSWMPAEDDIEEFSYNPSSWATRLAAGLIDLQLRHKENDIPEAYALWLSLLPEPDFLKASLPVHWPEDTLQNARSTALELAVDRAFFARAEAIEDLMDALEDCEMANGLNNDNLREMCNNALDLVQTRSCRPEGGSEGFEVGPPIRFMVPIFDFINHGSMRCRGEAGANAQFRLESSVAENDGRESNQLLVCATRDLKAGEEVLIDYGESARPAWKCLFSYGFVPQYNHIPDPGDSSGSGEEEEDDDENENVAEVFMDGIRYEVGPSSIPVDMVAAASPFLFASADAKGEEPEETEIALTPEVALKIARRISDVAYHLLLEPESDMYDDHPSATPTPFQVISNKLASSLRWSQHRTLLACALGLRQFATEE